MKKQLEELKLTKNIIIPFPNFQENTIISPVQMNDNFEEIENAYNALIDAHNGAVTNIITLTTKANDLIKELEEILGNLRP
jgi:hypothetical protein